MGRRPKDLEPNLSPDITATPVISPYQIDLEPEFVDEGLLKYTFEDTRSINNLKFILKDLLSGDDSVVHREEFSYLNFKQIKQALNWLEANNQLDDSFKSNLLTDSWRINFKAKPPTAHEMLGEKYLGGFSEFLWKPLKKEFITFMDPLQPYRTGIFSTSIGSGKSSLTILIMLMTAIHYGLMRNPRRFFGFPDSAVIVMCLCQVTLKKASEIYLEPMRQMIESAPFWKKCRTHDEMLKEDKHLMESDTVDYIPWTSSAPSQQPLYSKIKLPNKSFTTMGNLKINDQIASPSEGITYITGFPFKGKCACYEIELDDGSKTRCSINHKWKVSWRKYSSGEKIWEIVDTKFLIENQDLDIEIPVLCNSDQE